MLFSSADLASSINAAFEPVWETVRPVPIVTIDFGNGTKVTRTLHGNVATYLTDHEGTVYDILPGIYEPQEYRKQLEQFSLLFRHASQGFAPKKTERTEVLKEYTQHVSTMLKAYHERQANRLKLDQPADVLTLRFLNGGKSKAGIEVTVELLAAGDAAKLKAASQAAASKATPPPTDTTKLAGWKELAEDTKLNESIRRRAIHEKLAAMGRVKPNDIKKWLYKDVLHADLDDPMMGLGEALTKNYPFAAEDRSTVVPPKP